MISVLTCMLYMVLPFSRSVYFFEFSTHRGTCGHPLKLFYPDPRVSVRAQCFPV